MIHAQHWAKKYRKLYEIQAYSILSGERGVIGPLLLSWLLRKRHSNNIHGLASFNNTRHKI